MCCRAATSAILSTATRVGAPPELLDYDVDVSWWSQVKVAARRKSKSIDADRIQVPVGVTPGRFDSIRNEDVGVLVRPFGVSKGTRSGSGSSLRSSRSAC